MINRIYTKVMLSDRGASLIEYSLLVMLIAILGFVAVEFFGSSVSGSYSVIADELANAKP